MDIAISKSSASPAQLEECWKTIGVIGGDQSCPELQSHVHCRNCPVYAEAGVQLLDRALPPGYREEWSRRLAERKADAAAGKESAVVFRVSGEWLALPVPVFQEVAERRVIRTLPHQRDTCVLGLATVRGELLVCISLARWLRIKNGDEGRQPPLGGRLLVVRQHGQRLAFPVEEVAGIVRYQPQDLKRVPATMRREGGAFPRGLLDWKGQTVGLLDERQLFDALSQKVS